MSAGVVAFYFRSGDGKLAMIVGEVSIFRPNPITGSWMGWSGLSMFILIQSIIVTILFPGEFGMEPPITSG